MCPGALDMVGVPAVLGHVRCPTWPLGRRQPGGDGLCPRAYPAWTARRCGASAYDNERAYCWLRPGLPGLGALVVTAEPSAVDQAVVTDGGSLLVVMKWTRPLCRPASMSQNDCETSETIRPTGCK